MKRYEKMSKEKIMNIFLNPHFCNIKMCYEKINCAECARDWLNEEITTKPRWATLKSNDDWEDIYVEWVKKPNGIGIRNFIDWLKEEVEE